MQTPETELGKSWYQFFFKSIKKKTPKPHRHRELYDYQREKRMGKGRKGAKGE